MSANKRGLGKGLDALLATSSLARQKQNTATRNEHLSSSDEFRELPVSYLKPGQYQPRKDMEADALEELALSIRSQGVIQPIVVRLVAENSYEIIAGERRWRAARQAGLKVVPCIIKNVVDRTAIAMSLIENIQREDLNVIEEAQALERLQNEFELTHQQVAEVIGKSRTTVTNLLRLNQLENSIKHLVEQKKLEMGHARALLALDHSQQIDVAAVIIKKQLSVRDTEKLVKKWLEPTEEKPEVSVDSEAKMLSERLSEKLETPVLITRQPNGKGKLVISFDEHHKMEQLLAILER
ncbi:ParB/RepB/Spo0J family partition protein [Vibrio sp. Of7-15]|uniref:ParB/RepB/Spo0J family partition protein n=1 Tax=Vibrio sp. Of7-15 TaxID=2724879 RepID=UPI001EF2220D|nr:ParB/RepB/Spo0J family partition protein [Vibrio sp. Of7-15]MCG7499282.1 ParB/RepB/Spo0J family partition protein [Vibrio sp. Of7-15]